MNIPYQSTLTHARFQVSSMSNGLTRVYDMQSHLQSLYITSSGLKRSGDLPATFIAMYPRSQCVKVKESK